MHVYSHAYTLLAMQLYRHGEDEPENDKVEKGLFQDIYVRYHR